MAESTAQSLFTWIDQGGALNTLDVDVVMSSSDKRSARLTDHVVEDGSVITDHVVIQPEEVSFTLLVTQTPTRAPEGEGFAQVAVPVEYQLQALERTTVPISVQPSAFRPGGFLRLSTGLRSVVTGLFGAGAATPTSAQGSALAQRTHNVRANTLQAATPADRVAAVHDALVGILNGALLVTVAFKGRLYVDYLLTDVGLSEQAGKFGSAEFSVSARAFRTVTGTQVDLPDPADFRALPAVSKGNKAAQTPDPDPAKAPALPKTIGARLGDGVVDLFTRFLNPVP